MDGAGTGTLANCLEIKMGCRCAGTGCGGHLTMTNGLQVNPLGHLAYEALVNHAASDPTWPSGWTPRAWDHLPPGQQAAWEAAAQAVAHAIPVPEMHVTLAGYQGGAQHAYTMACDGFHPPGPCPYTVHI